MADINILDKNILIRNSNTKVWLTVMIFVKSNWNMLWQIVYKIHIPKWRYFVNALSFEEGQLKRGS